jgi:hypothetical protein
MLSLLLSALAWFVPPASESRAAPPRCASSGLVVWLDTQGDATAGSVYYSLEFTNESGRACSLAGFPGVSAVDLRGRALGTAAAWSRSPVHVITLPSGATASVALRVAAPANFPASACQPVRAAGLRVYAPNQSEATVVPFPFDACSKPGAIYLSVNAVVAGGDGRRADTGR